MIADDPVLRARRRLRAFLLHLALFAVVMVMVLVINVLFSPGGSWGIMAIVGWGGVLAIHAAYVMGLFDIFSQTPPKDPDEGDEG